jgi:hypothetical protein
MTRKALTLSLLRDAGERGVETAEFLNAGVGSRYGARLLELRNEGHVIEAERIRNGSWKYTLLSEAGIGAGPSRPSLGASVDSGGALPSGTDTAPPKSAAQQLFSPPSRYDRLREMDSA